LWREPRKLKVNTPIYRRDHGGDRFVAAGRAPDLTDATAANTTL